MKYTPKDRTIISVLLLLLAAVSVYHAYELATGQTAYTVEECHGKGSIVCHIMNMIFMDGGQSSLATLFIAIGFLLFYIASAIFSHAPQEAPTKTNQAVSEEIPVSPEKQTFEDVLNGEEPTDEFLEDFIESQNAEPVSEDELEKQALAKPMQD